MGYIELVGVSDNRSNPNGKFETNALIMRKSRPLTILPKSVVTKLLILPMRFCISFLSLVADLMSLLTVDESSLSFPFMRPFEVD